MITFLNGNNQLYNKIYLRFGWMLKWIDFLPLLLLYFRPNFQCHISAIIWTLDISLLTMVVLNADCSDVIVIIVPSASSCLCRLLIIIFTITCLSLWVHLFLFTCYFNLFSVVLLSTYFKGVYIFVILPTSSYQSHFLREHLNRDLLTDN